MSVRILTAVVLVVIAVLPVRAEEADPAEIFALAESAFEYQDYKKTVALLDPLLSPKPLLAGARLRKAREYLGTSYWWLMDKGRFNQEMTAWLVLEPGAELDSFFYPPEMTRDFAALKEKLLAMGVIQVRDDGGDPKKTEILVIERIRIERPPAVAWVPFGAGQFAAGRGGMGALFLTTEALALGANIGAWGWMAANDGGGEHREAAIITMYTSLGVFAAMTLWGVLDARLRWRRVEEMEQRRYEPAPADEPTVAPGPAALGGTVRWRH
ncbi:MAG: hypothetical protein ABIK09_04830 [Pseudomonadota bacterium]